MKATDIVASPHFRWAVLIAGGVIYILLKLLGILAVVNVEEIVGMQLESLISFALIALIYTVFLISYLIEKYRSTRYPNEVVYTRAQFIYDFYEGGDFHGQFIYNLRNLSSETLDALPLESFYWTQIPDRSQIKFRIIYKDGHRLHRLDQEEPLIGKRENWFINDVLGQQTHYIAWEPKIIPPLDPKEEIVYEADVWTPGTETDAFTSEGANLGFPTGIFTGSAKLIARAPRNYKFVLKTPPMSVIDNESGNSMPSEEVELPDPVLTDDGSLLEWKLNRFRQHRRYWINYRFERKSHII